MILLTMRYNMNILSINQSIQGMAVESSHFKNVVMSIRFFLPLAPINNTKTALLAQLIKDRNKKYSTKSQMQALKDNLYGANISSRTFGYGPTQVLEVRIGSISERFVNEPLQAKQLATLADLIYQPLINQETLNEAKRTVADRINRAKENPMSYSVFRALEELGSHSTLGLPTQGSIDDLSKISVDDMIEFHQYLIFNAKAQLVIGGNFKSGLLNSIGIIFKYHQPLESTQPYNLYNDQPTSPVVEIAPINQATLIEVYQSLVSVEDPLYYAYRIGNVILGQLPTSHLFQEVREKNSLAYSVSSRIIAYEGLLLLTTSLDQKNIEFASDLMKAQVERIKNGDFTDLQLQSAKQMMINSLEGVYDDEYALVNFIFDSSYRNLGYDYQLHQKNYVNITREMVIESFKNMQPIFQFQLKGEKHETVNQ